LFLLPLCELLILSLVFFTREINLIKLLHLADHSDSLLIRQDNRSCMLAYESVFNLITCQMTSADILIVVLQEA
jgi:hypothetical protein